MGHPTILGREKELRSAMLILPMLLEAFPLPEAEICRLRERPWRVRNVRASMVEKLRAAWVR
jgi:hypothetical protein